MLNKLLTSILVFLTGVMFLIIPSISVDNWMNETQSGKTFVFLYGITGIGVFTFIRFIFLKNYRNLKISLLDLLLFIWVAYILTNGILHKIPFSLRILDLIGLIVLYLVIRQMKQEYYPLLFMALMSGGLMQTVCGNLQLWGYYPSHHGLYKMTGSFFNPGPYAGYLASVFPVALGFYLLKIKLLTPRQKKVIYYWSDRIKRKIYKTIGKGIKYFPKHAHNLKEILAEKQQEKSSHFFYAYALAFSTIITIILVIPATRSRASWLAIVASTCFLLIVRYKVFLRDLFPQFLNTVFKKGVFALIVILLIGLGSIGLYHFKKGSADGRLLVWKVTAHMIQDNPLTGVGLDRFKAHYMDYQAGFFQQNPDSEEAMVAGDTNYAFNEIFQVTAENGFVGFLLVLLILVVVFTDIFQNENKSLRFYRNRKLIFISESPNTDSYKKASNINHFILIAKAGIICILIFGLFAYPLQILPIKMNFVLFLVTISCKKTSVINFSLLKNRFVFTLNPKGNNQIFLHAPFRTGVNQVRPSRKIATKTETVIVPILAKIVLTICILFGAGWAIKQIKIYTDSYKNWHEAYLLYHVGVYEKCLEDYKEVYPILKNNGDFLTNYGKALSMSEKHSEAVYVLQQATTMFPNVVVYTALGDSYKRLHEPQNAEKAYLQAWYMNPSKFYPKYLLAKLYDETGQIGKAVYTANELLEKEIKIESIAVQEILDEMQIIKEKGNL